MEYLTNNWCTVIQVIIFIYSCYIFYLSKNGDALLLSFVTFILIIQSTFN